jgi:hypothetical protein
VYGDHCRQQGGSCVGGVLSGSGFDVQSALQLLDTISALAHCLMLRQHRVFDTAPRYFNCGRLKVLLCRAGSALSGSVMQCSLGGSSCCSILCGSSCCRHISQTQQCGSHVETAITMTGNMYCRQKMMSRSSIWTRQHYR